MEYWNKVLYAATDFKPIDNIKSYPYDESLEKYTAHYAPFWQ